MKPWRSQLADAHQATRKAKNQIAELEKQVAFEVRAKTLALDRVGELERIVRETTEQLALFQANLARRKKSRPLTDTELLSLASVAMIDMLPPTAERLARRTSLLEELVYRQVLVLPGDL